MSTHATSSKQWKESDLALLPIEEDFRLRGLEVTRLDTFIDAAFAFVLTLLVISFDEIPASYDEMMIAVKRIPGFVASFSVLMLFWLSHRRWSRRFGLETSRSVFLSLAVIFVVLVYVYPLRIIFEGMFWSLSSGYFTADFRIETAAELRGMFIFYSIGSLVMSILFCDLYRSASASAAALSLNAAEQEVTTENSRAWLIVAIYSAASIALSFVLPDNLIPIAGYMYALVYPTILLVRRITQSSG